MKNQDSKISKHIFTQNFIYAICKVIFGKERMSQQEDRFSLIGLANTYIDFTTLCPAFVSPLNNRKGYASSLSDSCKIVATTYLNYYVENIEGAIAKYLISKIKNQLPVRKYKSILHHVLYSVSLIYHFD